MQTTLPHGVWPVMLTPFTVNNAIDVPALDALIEWYIDNGAAGLFAICQSSEMDFLSIDEKQSLLQHIMRRTDGRLPVVTAGMPVDDSAAYARFCQDQGVAALVILPNRLISKEKGEHACWNALQHVMEQLPDIDLGLYECPQPYHRLLSADFVRRCAQTERFVFMKETSCQRALLAAKLEACRGSRLQLYVAHGPSVLFGLQRGASGCSNIAANIAPQLYAQLCHNRDSDEAHDLQQLLTLIDPHLRLCYPACAKRWLQSRGLPITDHCRSTIDACRLDDEALRFEAVRHQLSAMAVIKH